jgi:hypothetical protein
MEAENFLASGYGTRVAIEAKPSGWHQLSHCAQIWQPPRLKGTIVSNNHGQPYLSATQVFDVRPISRRYLSLEKIGDPSALQVTHGQILVTRSGSVGRSTLAHAVHDGHIISDDLLRVTPKDQSWWGWLYAYLRAPTVREMMKAAQYGHIIKHLEVHHLGALPVVDADASLRAEIDEKVTQILRKRDRAYELTLRAEHAFEEAFGTFSATDFGESGFSTRAHEIFSTSRRRLDAWHYNPSARTITAHLSKKSIAWSPLQELGFKVWLPTRFRRVSAIDGVPLLDSSDLFETNPDITKSIADGDFGDPFRGRVQRGWVLLSRSGQIYGLNGSAMITGHCHEEKVISDHIIRIAPEKAKCRVGYLLVAITHPKLGRPRIKTLPYGSSIPEIEVADMQQFPIPRLATIAEDQIAGWAEEAARLRDEADEIETSIGEQSDAIVSNFLAHKSR